MPSPHPKRGIGNTTLEKLGTYSAERHISLFAAAFETGLEMQLQAKQLEPLHAFCKFIHHLQYRAPREPAGRLMQELLQAIDYETWLYDSEETRAPPKANGKTCSTSSPGSAKGEEDGKT